MLETCVKTVSNMLVLGRVSSGSLYTVNGLFQQVRMSYSGIVREIHQSIPQIPMVYSTTKNTILPLKIGSFTTFPQSLLLPTERILK